MRAVLMAVLVALAACDGNNESGGRSDAGDLGLGLVDSGVGRDGGPRDAVVQVDVAVPDMRRPDADLGPSVDMDLGPAPCEDGVIEECGACEGAVRSCQVSVWSACAPPAEVCNGLDDDCDGEVDETFVDLSAPCVSGRGICASHGVRVCAADQASTQCNAVPLPAVVEACNRVDDDCDGMPDESSGLVCYPGSEATRGVGLCADGSVECEAGAPGSCRGAVLPVQEVCNTFDDDCDGYTDEDAVENPCYSGPVATRNVGLCGTGIRYCEAGVAGGCTGEVLPAREICDGNDNDCDEATDEGMDCVCEPGAERDCYSGPDGTVGVGACRMGHQRCTEQGRWGVCADEKRPEGEICDGQDGDCNGEVDDHIMGVGLVCFLGRGACREEGLLGCDAVRGLLSCDAEPGDPADERCNGDDDDCDGQVDEGLGLGAVCTDGLGACQAEGRAVCGPGGGLACAAPVGAPVAELCNAVDDDCDGQNDEDFALGTDCQVGRGRCQRAGVRVCDAVGQGACSVPPGDPAPESCDGTDEDCDGQVDEGNPGGGQDCNTGALGVCAAGERTCQAGLFVCVPRVAAGAEVCDGLDNDCNGRVDVDRAGAQLLEACYEGPPGTEGVGRCGRGARACEDGAFGGCRGQVVPGEEICNLADDDCDGVVDEGLERVCVCRPGEDAPCYSGPVATRDVGACQAGRQACLPEGDAFGPCLGEVLPSVEVCDGIDNDCNGLTDDLLGVGEACAVGVGACRSGGTRVCNPATGRLQCSGEPGSPELERCDGQDNDCNGLVDDVPNLGGACTAGRGACLRGGNLVCDAAAGVLACNAVPGAEGDEICDGEDDDCDGVLDENVAGAGVRCTAGLGQCRRAGETACEGATGRIICGAQPGAPEAERCNGLDDDCDGRVDEQAIQVGEACSEGIGRCAADGARRCVGGQLICDARPGAPGLEVCGGEDDDCDGQVDEGLECRAFRSCQDVLDQGFDRSGVYRLDPDGDGRNAVDVWCDQTTDGGGWTLVVSSRNAPPNDARLDWYADLTTLAPAAGHVGVWDGMRPRIPEGSDVRFVCRDGVGAAGGPMTVDLSFYEVPWYREVTTGDDAASCFSEAGSPDPAPARRNNLTHEIRGPGQGWYAEQGQGRALEGEDTCLDVGDFTVDFEDRGMDSNQGDGTDWGKDDGSFKCGRTGIASGQWFLYVREPRRAPLARVAVVGSVNLEEPLRTAGFAVTTWAFAALPPNLDLRGFDVVFLGRYANDWRQVTPALSAALTAYSEAGGHLVTEYDGLALLAVRYQQDFRYLAGAPAPLGWFPFAVGAGGVRGVDTPVAAVPQWARDPILRSLPEPLRGGGGTEQFFTVSTLDQGIETQLRPLALFPGMPGSPNFPGGTYPALLRGLRCGGHIFVGVFDYHDRPISAGVRQLIVNLAASATSPPPGDLMDLCP